MRGWIDAHWGDLIALLVLYTGILMAILQLGGHLPESLVLAGMAGLKLRTPGNGSGPKGEANQGSP